MESKPPTCTAGVLCEAPAVWQAKKIENLRACGYHRTQQDASIRPYFIAWSSLRLPSPACPQMSAPAEVAAKIGLAIEAPRE